MSELDPRELMETIGRKARAASRDMARAATVQKNEALKLLALALTEHKDRIFAANALDVKRAGAAGLPAPFVDRLTITEKVLETMADGCRQIASLADPAGTIESVKPQESGIGVGRMRVPLGVVGIIYEARPNVTVDAAALALKAGNAVILRGGSEAFETNKVLAGLVADALSAVKLNPDSVQVAPTTDRAFVGELIKAVKYVDVIIPRGGKSLIARLEAEARVPMIRHLDGICHTYVDAEADTDLALTVCDNAKTQRYSPCNAMETLLVHEKQAAVFLPSIARIWQEKDVEMRCDNPSYEILTQAGFTVKKATEDDWDTEYNAPIISIAVVPSFEAAVSHIETHGSHHTDAIITTNHMTAERFLREVDSGSVMVNCSTRLADGYVYGLGAEIGISTGKLHARGPVGLEGLTSLKYVVYGHGECRR